MPSRRGGSRPNSGRKLRSQTLGPPQRNALTNYFNSTNNATTPTRTLRSTRNSQAAASDANTTAAARNTQIAHQAVEANNPTPNYVRNNMPDMPNFNAEDILDDSLSFNAKFVKSSKNLKLQIDYITTLHFYSSTRANIEEHGKLSWYPPQLVKTPTVDIKERWLDFFKLRVFNWIPEAMIGEGWRPSCPNCNNKLSKNGNAIEPRLVFDLHENYWLNSPHRYICSDCKNNEKAYNFRSTSPELVKQLESTHPEIAALFPCHLTKKNAIDKNLLNSMIHHAVKGVGPIAFRETIISLHELQWQVKENLWASHMLEKLNGSVLYRHVDRATIEKCPEYFSKAIGGCVPSGSWLVHVFCESLSQNRKYFDSECVKRAKSTKVLAIDASYKVPKWMMKWGKNVYTMPCTLVLTNTTKLYYKDSVHRIIMQSLVLIYSN